MTKIFYGVKEHLENKDWIVAVLFKNKEDIPYDGPTVKVCVDVIEEYPAIPSES